MKIKLNDELIDIVIVRKKIKNIYFRFNEENKLVVSVPVNVSEKYLENLIKSNYNSLSKMYTKVQKKQDNEKKFSYLGKNYVVIYDENVKEVNIDNDYITFKNAKAKDKFLASECERVFENRINTIKPYISYVPKFRLRIRKKKSAFFVFKFTPKRT